METLSRIVASIGLSGFGAYLCLGALAIAWSNAVFQSAGGQDWRDWLPPVGFASAGIFLIYLACEVFPFAISLTVH